MSTRFCSNCGQPIEGDVRFCTQCGAPIPQAEPTPPPYEPQPQMAYGQNSYETPQPQASRPQPTGPKPSNFLVWAILSTIFCCLPFGIVAIVMAAKVDNLWNTGHYQEAEDASRKAKTWTLVAAIVGLVIGALYYFLFFKAAAAAGASWSSILQGLS